MFVAKIFLHSDFCVYLNNPNHLPLGQSFGAFLARGVTLELEGDANDYIGKVKYSTTILSSCTENNYMHVIIHPDATYEKSKQMSYTGLTVCLIFRAFLAARS